MAEKNPTSSQLRPLTTVQLLDAAWLAVRRNWLVLYACSGAGAAPLALSTMLYFLWLGRIVEGTSNTYFYSGTLVWAVAMALFWAWNSVARNTVTALVLADARGEPPDVSLAWRQAGRHAAGATFVGLASFAAGGLGSTCLAPGIFLALGWWVARPVLLTEGRPFAAALRRSWRLTEGYRFHAFGLWLLFVALWGIGFTNLHLLIRAGLEAASGLLGIDTSGILQSVRLNHQPYVMFLLTLMFVLLDPLKAAADAVLYLDLRVRREGADLQERLRAMRVSGTALVLFMLALAAPAQAIPKEDYLARIRTLRQQVEAARGPDQVDGDAVRALRSRIVEIGDQKVTVDNAWLQNGVEKLGTPAEKEALLQRLTALERSLAGSGTQPTANASAQRNLEGIDTKREIQQILQDPEFQPLAARPELQNLAKKVDFSQTKNWWESFWDWVRKTFFSPQPPRTPPPPRTNLQMPPMDWLKWVVYILVGVVVLFLLALLVKFFLERPRHGTVATAASSGEAPPLEASNTENALDHTVDEWERFAQQWLGRGDVRQAIRALYLATLVHLHRERRIDYNRAFTNWVYVRQFRGEGEHRELLGQLTRTFDEVWYGEHPCGEEHYRAFELGVRSLGTPAPV